MSSQKAEIFRIDKNEKKGTEEKKTVFKRGSSKEKNDFEFTLNKEILKEWCIGILIYALVLWIVSCLFKGLYIENLFYAVIAAIILTILNYYLKPALKVFFMPINILFFGLLSPLANIVILYMCDLIMGKFFVLGGFFSAFVISIAISFLKYIFDEVVLK